MLVRACVLNWSSGSGCWVQGTLLTTYGCEEPRYSAIGLTGLQDRLPRCHTVAQNASCMPVANVWKSPPVADVSGLSQRYIQQQRLHLHEGHGHSHEVMELL